MPSKEQPRVLIVEEDPFVLDIISSHLTGAGFDIHIASSMSLAITRMVREQYDAILCDIALMCANGGQPVRELWKRNPHLKGNFVFFTGAILSLLRRFNAKGGSRPVRVIKQVELDEILQAVNETMLGYRSPALATSFRPARRLFGW